MKLHYQETGKGNPVIILHGFLGTSDNWITIARALSQEYRVFLVDQRNHGLSPHSEEFSYPLMARDLHEFITDRELQEPVIIGHSMGGKVTMQYSVDYHDAFSKLIIVDIAPRFYPVHHQDILNGLLSIDLEKLDSRTEADRQLSLYVKDAGVRQFLLKNLNRTKEGFSWKANLPVLNRLIEKVGIEIKGEKLTEKPVYFIAGSRSDYIRKEDREDIKKMYPSAGIITIREAGHWVHSEQQENFLKSVRYMLNQ